jgi:hypothetical protein
MNGQGKMTYQNGNEYDGHWKDNKRHGTGKMTYKVGGVIFVHDGTWNNDKLIPDSNKQFITMNSHDKRGTLSRTKSNKSNKSKGTNISKRRMTLG